ncbi:MAG: cytochrome P460 family protein [Bryobacteraceae bacterium]
MVKDSKKFTGSGGWGYAVFDYDAASDTFKPGTLAGTPPQGNGAKCGFACHPRAKTREPGAAGVLPLATGIGCSRRRPRRYNRAFNDSARPPHKEFFHD